MDILGPRSAALSTAKHGLQIDVIVPCFNYGRFLRACVSSVLSQRDVSLRVLVLNDASTDDSLEVATALAREDQRVSVVAHNVNRGHIATYNEGLAWVRAPFYLLLSADDSLVPGALARATSVLHEHPEVGFVFGQAVDWSGEPRPEKDAVSEGTCEYQILTGLEFADWCGARNPVRTPTAVVRTSLQARVGGYRADLPHAGDLEMWLRLAAVAKVGRLSAVQALYRVHDANMSREYVLTRQVDDVAERRVALETFFDSVGRVSDGKDVARVRRRAMALLSADALRFASALAGTGGTNRITLKRIVGLAILIAPKSALSLQLAKVCVKDVVGDGPWKRFRAIARRA